MTKLYRKLKIKLVLVVVVRFRITFTENDKCQMYHVTKLLLVVKCFLLPHKIKFHTSFIRRNYSGQCLAAHSREHHAFLYISLPLLHDFHVKVPNFPSHGGRIQATRNFRSISELGFGSLEFKSRSVCLHLAKLVSWNNSNGD